MNNPGIPSPAIQAKHLRIGYKDEVIVSDINIELMPRQSLALIGTNGSGKSTLLKTLVGLLPKIGGELSVLGNAPEQSIRQMAYLSQFHANGLFFHFAQWTWYAWGGTRSMA
jgi:ABC-type Mn2+/Zn2+ transport system ATPase subunit